MPHFQLLSSATLYTVILETAQTKPTAVIEQSSTIQVMEVINLELKDFNKVSKKESLQSGRTKRQNSSFSIKSHTLYASGNNKFNSQLINSLPPESTFEMTHNCHIHKPRVSKSHVSSHMQLSAAVSSPSLPIQIPSLRGSPCSPKVRGTWTESSQDTGARNSSTAAACPQTAVQGGAMEGATQMKQSNVSWVGADFSQLKRLQIFFPLGELMLSLVTSFMFPYPNLQWSKNLIQPHLC